MTEYNATVETSRRDEDPDDALMDALAAYHPSIHTSPRGWLSATITVPAENLTQAAQTALAVVATAARSDAVSIEVMPTAEFDKRNGFDPLPELVSVTEAAAQLGVSRQAILDRIGRHTLPATKIGRDYAIPRAALH